MKRILLLVLVISVLLLGASGCPSTAPSTEAPPAEEPALTTYTLSVSVSPSGAGSVSPSSGQYEEGTQVTLTATAASGYTFDYWDGAASGSEATITFTMDSDKSIVAHFADTTPPPVEAATEVGGIISSNTIWTAEKSPYEITETIQIPEGITLTIEPGVAISKPSEGDMFLLLGTIHAHGNAQEPIVFDGGGNSTIISTDPGHGSGDFEYCVFKNGYRLWDRWGKLNLRYSQLINLTPGRSNYPFAEAIIELDGPSGEINIEYNKFVNTGGIYSYANEYGINIRYNLFEGLLSPLCNCGGGTPQTPNKMVVQFNSFVDIEGIILWLEPTFSPTIDATHNYWDTTDTSIIDAKIYDGNDDVRIGSYITYLPILTSPHPSTPTP